MVLFDYQDFHFVLFCFFNLNYYLYEVQSQMHRQETKWWLPGAKGRRMGSCLMGTELQLCKMKPSGDLLYNSVNILNVTELYT